MQKQAPTLSRLLVMAGFALSCFGLILFLWVAFGGPVPLAAKGYQVKVDFKSAGLLASQADVRISGVPVGKVATVELAPGNATRATLQIDPRYAPIPADTRAIARTKTLLGETYVELTPGDRANGPALADGAMLPPGQVRQQVTIDRIFQTFDAPTRRAWQEWQQSAAGAYAGRGGAINDGFGNLPAFTESADNTLRVLNSQSDAVSSLIRDTGIVFNALSTRTEDFRGLARSWNTVWNTTALRNQQLAQTFQILPTFEQESAKTLKVLQAFAVSADPLVKNQLIPAAQQLSPLLQSVQQLAPSLKTVATKLGPMTDASVKGVPALTTFLNGSGQACSSGGPSTQRGLDCVLGHFSQLFQQVNPMLEFLTTYKTTIPGFFANTTAASQGVFGGDAQHYLRGATPLNLLGLAALPHRPTSNRASPYVLPNQGQYAYPTPSTHSLTGYETSQCTSGSFMPLSPTSATSTQPFNDSDADVAKWLKNIVFAGASSPQAPGCDQQGNVGAFTTLFPLIKQQTP